MALVSAMSITTVFARPVNSDDFGDQMRDLRNFASQNASFEQRGQRGQGGRWQEGAVQNETRQNQARELLNQALAEGIITQELLDMIIETAEAERGGEGRGGFGRGRGFGPGRGICREEGFTGMFGPGFCIETARGLSIEELRELVEGLR